MTYKPQYPIIDQADMLPREQMQLVPENELDPLDRAELSRMREGRARYKVLVADTRANRENIALKTTYFQMVAYAEGWEFNPDKYQVEFVDPNYFLLAGKGTQTRIWEFEEGAEIEGLSPERRAGFTIRDDQAERMGHEETDGLAGRIIKLFPD